jgi:hypothetical protein
MEVEVGTVAHPEAASEEVAEETGDRKAKE